MNSSDNFPAVYKFHRTFKDGKIKDIDKAVENAFTRFQNIKSGSEVAVAVGSRGIASINHIVKKTIEELKIRGYKPFIVPAMGSHAGATADSQKEMLGKLGITEKLVGAPIRSSTDTKLIGRTDAGLSVYFDSEALKADAIVLINRIKPHTSFEGRYESGLVKMMAVGMGNLDAARELHASGTWAFKNQLKEIAEIIINNAPIKFGIAIVQNAANNIKIIEGLNSDEIILRESDLLDIARKEMPDIPVNNIDVLIIDEMGKDISGTGMDPHVIGRRGVWGEPDPQPPVIKKIVVLNITDASMGNANGIGMADAITDRLASKINWKITRENVLTTTFLEKGKMPLPFPSDKEAIIAAVKGAWVKQKDVRLVRIKNTLVLDQFWVSEVLKSEIKDADMTQKSEITFSANGQIWDF